MNVNKYVKSFIKDYKIIELDRNMLEDVITKLGYRIIKFNPVFNDESVDEIITSLALEEAVKHNQSFTFGNKIFKRVFIRDDIGDKDSIPIMLHEIGHIYMGHVKQGLVENDVRLENEANQFSLLVSQAVDSNSKRHKIITALVCLSISLLVMAMISIDIKQSRSSRSENNDILESGLFSENITHIPAETEPPVTEPKESIERLETSDDISEYDDVYYITSGGAKYHKDFCTVIQNKTNIYRDTKEDLENMGYEPCQLCIGDE